MANNREYVSDVFSMLLEESEYALNVYNGVNGSNYEDPAEVEICVLEKGISLSVRNDASFIVASDLNLYEHQSTYNPNMALRELFYLVDVLKVRIKKQKDDIYGSKKIMIPTPKFAVFYTGLVDRPEKEIFKLSDLFLNNGEIPQIELECVCYNIVKGNNRRLLQQFSILGEYVTFVEKVREYKTAGISEYLSEAIDWCIANDILKDFLGKRKDEVVKAMILDMTFEAREELIRRDAFAEGKEMGKEIGEELFVISQVITKCKKQKTLVQIADETEKNVEYIRPIYNVVVDNLDKSAEWIYEMLHREDDATS